MRIFVLSLLVLLATLLTHAAIRDVPSVYPTIQEGILAAENGDTVLVAEGEYFENLDFRGRSIVVGSLFVVDSDIEHVPNTIINGSQPVDADTGSVVRIINGEDSTTALIGFTITGGTGTKFRDQSDQQFYVEGGGVLIENSDPLIAYNFIMYNEATRDPDGTVSAGGGGIRYGYCAPRIHNNVIMYNTGRYGAGVVSFFADGELQHNAIANNEGGQDYGGGGLWIGGAGHATTLINCNITGNASALSGGGIRLFAGVLNAHSNIIWGNRANTGSQQVGGATGNLHLDYNCVSGGHAGLDNVADYPMFLTNNMRLHPMSPCIDTGNPDNAWNDEDETRNDMGIFGGPGSTWYPPFGDQQLVIPTLEYELVGEPQVAHIPLLNYGVIGVTVDSLTLVVGEEILIDDELLEVRPFNADTVFVRRPHIGEQTIFDTLEIYHSDEDVPNPVRITLFAVGTSAVESPAIVPADFALYPAFPNPFNPSTMIRFTLPHEEFVSLTVHDLQGREVAKLMQSRLAAGEHAITWNAANLASGTYFTTLQAGKWHSNQKLLLLK